MGLKCQGLFLAFPGIARIQRCQGSLDLDSMEGKYWNKSYSTIYIFVPAKSAVHTRGTNYSAVNTRAANRRASDIKFTATVLAFLPGLIIHEQ